MNLIKSLFRFLLSRIYRVEVRGAHHLAAAGERVLVVANHTSFLDALMLALFLPERLTFAVNSHIARRWWLRPILALLAHFPMDPTSPLALKGLIQQLKSGHRVAIFPEGRITVTGSLMKVYDGAAVAAVRAGAQVVPVRIDGLQFSRFARVKGPRHLLPRVTLTVLEPCALVAEGEGRQRREAAGRALSELMAELVFTTTEKRQTLHQALCEAASRFGSAHPVTEDVQREPLAYGAFTTRVQVLARALGRETAPGERVGFMLPNTNGALTAFFALQAGGRVPAMLNHTLGLSALQACVETAGIGTVITSRRFIELAKLEETAQALAGTTRLLYLEEVAAGIGMVDKLAGWLAARLGSGHAGDADDAAVILFTSGSEGLPKGVVLSHANLLANRAQVAARFDFRTDDVVFNALPLFHSFGLTAGTLLPVLSGMKVFLYPSPLHYKVVPEMAYDSNATILFGTSTFLSGYGRNAHPYDFYNLRYVFAGAERLAEETRRLWAEKFGIRVLEGYGATETAPVLAVNSPMAHRPGSVGRLLPGMEHRLEAVPGVASGGRLYVRGPNVMRGYLLHGEGGRLVPPEAGWYDTGDIVEIDGDGFVTILGRAKRFAKIGGEMVSLAAVEALAAELWPEARHAVVTLPDARKGEQLVLVTEVPGAERSALAEQARRVGVAELQVPRRVVSVPELPLLGSGKTDYGAVTALVEGMATEMDDGDATIEGEVSA